MKKILAAIYTVAVACSGLLTAAEPNNKVIRISQDSGYVQIWPATENATDPVDPAAETRYAQFHSCLEETVARLGKNWRARGVWSIYAPLIQNQGKLYRIPILVSRVDMPGAVVNQIRLTNLTALTDTKSECARSANKIAEAMGAAVPGPVPLNQ